jgi:hypothetical protein
MRFLKSERGVEFGRAIDEPGRAIESPYLSVIPSAARDSLLVTRPRMFGRSFAVCAAQDDSAVFFGNVGRNFAITTNAIPIAIRKKEKNCPRVKTPMSGASGSRKYSQMMRKIA